MTKRQAAALRLIADAGHDHIYVDEGTIASELWPTIIRVRSITNALVRQGLITYGDFNGDDGGFELLLTEAGRALFPEPVR